MATAWKLIVPVRQPAHGIVAVRNSCLVVALGVDKVRFTLRDGKGVYIGTPIVVPVFEGRAECVFPNPKPGANYSLIIADPLNGVAAQSTTGFNVGEAVPVPIPIPTPLPVPLPPTPVPVPVPVPVPTPVPTPTPSVVRGRPVISGNTVKSDQGTLLRGATMALDGPGTRSTKFSVDPANWAMLRDLGLNVIRVDVPLSLENLSLAQQKDDIDQIVECAAQTGMYLLLMNSTKSGTYSRDELMTFWGWAAPRFKDRTHVFYEQTNEPTWDATSNGNPLVKDLADIYAMMHAAAPETLIGVLDYSAVIDINASINRVRDLQSRGVTFGPAFVAFHAYWTPQNNIADLRNAFPSMCTEHVYQNAGEDDVDRLGQCEKLGVSWISLCGRWGTMTNADDPFGASVLTLRTRTLPGLRKINNWASDVLGGGPTPTPAPTPTPVPTVTPAILSIEGDIANAKLGSPTVLTVKTAGITDIEWVTVQGNAGYTWRNNLTSQATSGTTTLNFVPVDNGDFIKVMAQGKSISKDSARVSATPTPTPSPTPTPTPVPSGDDAAFAFAFRNSLRHGINFERWRPVYMSWRGNSCRDSTAYYTYLKNDCGVNFVRFFYPWHNDADMMGNGVTMVSGRRPSVASIQEFLRPIVTCVSAGVKAIIDFTDVVAWDTLGSQWGNVAAHMTDFSNEVSKISALSPEMVAVGPYNELMEWKSTNAEYNKFRIDAHKLIRAKLPKHIIVHGANGWDGWDKLTAGDWQAPPDKRSMGQWHNYDSATIGASHWKRVNTAMEAFSTRHGIPTYCGEAGPDDFQNFHYSGRWLQSVEDHVSAMPLQAHCWWAVTDGSDFRMNVSGSDLTIVPDLAAKLKATSSRLGT